MSVSEPATESSPNNSGRGLSKTATALIAIVVVAALVLVPVAYLLLTQTGNEEETPPVEVVVKVTGKGEMTELNITDLQSMDYVEEMSSYQNRFGNWKGEGTYKGVLLEAIADEVGGMEPGDIMTIEASDGYTQNLSFYQVYPDSGLTGTDFADAQGDIVLAFGLNGTIAPDWADGPMIAVLAPDGAFSNDDFNKTADRDPEFASSTSAGSIWVKNVKNITITAVYSEWIIGLENNLDPDNYTLGLLTRTDFVGLDYWFGSYFVDSKDRNWSGVPVGHVLGTIDDEVYPDLNIAMLETRYRVTITATDEYNKTMVAEDLVAGGALLAYKLNGSILPPEYAPLKLVGPNLTSSLQVGMVELISLIEPDMIILNVEGNANLSFSMTDLKSMPSFSGPGALIKSTGTIVGPNNFKGVPLGSLVEMVYTDTNYSLEVIASDGYSMTYTSTQVIDGTYPYYDAGGNIAGVGNFTTLLAYEMDGQPLIETIRIVIVDPSSPITDGHLWAKYVKYIVVKPFAQDYNITLSGLSEMTLDRQTYESVSSCYFHSQEYTLTNASGSFVYEGVALWVLVSAVDGADAPDGHYMFNDMLATAGYNVTVYAADGYNKTFPIGQVARNNSMIVANKVDGETLPDEEFPLRLVGENLTGSQMVKRITRIALENISGDVPSWNLYVNGTSNIVIDAGAFEALYHCGIHSSWYNFTNGTGDHSYAGIPLWVLVGAVDGDDGTGHYVWNASLAATGYTVRIIAGDGYAVELPVTDVALNDTLMIAFMVDGAYLTGTSYPLKLVGNTLPSSMSVKGVVAIELVGLPT